jgi:transposase-like protein
VFRAEAVELARPSGKGHPELARELGVAKQELRGWTKRFEADAGRPRSSELATAKREEVRQERAIVRKSATFFTRETL